MTIFYRAALFLTLVCNGCSNESDISTYDQSLGKNSRSMDENAKIVFAQQFATATQKSHASLHWDQSKKLRKYVHPLVFAKSSGGKPPTHESRPMFHSTISKSTTNTVTFAATATLSPSANISPTPSKSFLPTSTPSTVAPSKLGPSFNPSGISSIAPTILLSNNPTTVSPSTFPSSRSNSHPVRPTRLPSFRHSSAPTFSKRSFLLSCFETFPLRSLFSQPFSYEASCHDCCQ